MKPYKLLQHYGVYNPGEIAGFDDLIGPKLVTRGIAEIWKGASGAMEVITLKADTAQVEAQIAEFRAEVEATDARLSAATADLEAREAALAEREKALAEVQSGKDQGAKSDAAKAAEPADLLPVQGKAK